MQETPFFPPFDSNFHFLHCERVFLSPCIVRTAGRRRGGEGGGRCHKEVTMGLFATAPSRERPFFPSSSSLPLLFISLCSQERTTKVTSLDANITRNCCLTKSHTAHFFYNHWNTLYPPMFSCAGPLGRSPPTRNCAHVMSWKEEEGDPAASFLLHGRFLLNGVGGGKEE